MCFVGRVVDLSPLDTCVSHARYLARDLGDSAEGIQSSSAGFWGVVGVEHG